MVSTENNIGENNKMTVYEVSYLFLPNISEEQIVGKVLALKEMIKSLGGILISDENPIYIELAYEMTKIVLTTRHKVQSGYFGWIKFEVSSEQIGSIKKSLDSNDNILRYLIIKTVRENTLLSGKMILKKEEKVKKDDMIEDVVVDETLKETTDIDLDKSIDDLVIV